MVTFIRPCEGVITSPFGIRTHGGVTNLHQGIDIAKTGTVPILASADGVVSRVYRDKAFGTYGNVVFIKHGKTAETVYAHLRSYSVKVGQAVKQGQQIGVMGNTDGGSGRSTGQHLHFEINVPVWNQKHNSVDPMPYLNKKEVEPVAKTRYSDVGKSSASHDALERIADLKIINGYSDGTFRPNEALTRGQMAIIIDRLVTALKG